MRHLEFIPPHFDPPTTPGEQPDLSTLPNLPLTELPTQVPIHPNQNHLDRLRQRKDQYNEESSNNFGSSNYQNIKINHPELLHSLLPMVMGLYLALLLFLYLILRHARGEREREEGINIPQQVSRMNSEQRREYFGYLFRANNTQRTLRSEQIKIRTKNKGCNGRGDGSGDGDDDDDEEAQRREIDVEQPSSSTFEDSENDNYNDASVCLSLSDGDSDDNDSDDNDNDANADNDNQDTNGDNSSKRNKSRNKNKKKTIPKTASSSSKIPGECAICLEIYKSGDRVVRSEDKSRCPHVFHKECLVEYLAINKQKHNDPEQQRKGREAPPKCPICRQSFCALLAPPPKRRRSRSSSTRGRSRKS